MDSTAAMKNIDDHRHEGIKETNKQELQRQIERNLRVAIPARPPSYKKNARKKILMKTLRSTARKRKLTMTTNLIRKRRTAAMEKTVRQVQATATRMMVSPSRTAALLRVIATEMLVMTLPNIVTPAATTTRWRAAIQIKTNCGIQAWMRVCKKMSWLLPTRTQRKITARDITH